MPETKTEKRRDTGVSGIDLGNSAGGKRASYHVVIDGVMNQVETLDSFAIKFGLLTNIPVTKIKYILRNLPVSMWEGTSKSKANGLLLLVEEAGGVGRIVREDPKSVGVESNPDMKAARPKSCGKCGFSLGKDDDFCQFCMARIGEEQVRQPKSSTSFGKSVKTSFPPARLLFYLLVVFAAVLITFVIKS
ncbi:MAG: hypothetical protein KAV42_07410 [Candidatus Krumholzibacteria bacterium]|nr:hypothetical protein [Candidatus Krumholzibacteria bacterium]